MANNYDTVRGVDWREVFPWTALTRAFTVAVSIPVLLLASFGVGLTFSGWEIADSLLIPESATVVQPADYAVPAIGPIAEDDPRSVFERLLVGEGLVLLGDLHEVLMGGDRDLDARTRYAICIVDFVWLLVVWGFFGAMITRIAVIRIGRGEKIGLKEAMTDVRKKYISYVMSPLFVLVSCFVLSLPIVLISLLLNFDIGVLLASVLWIVAIVASIGVAVLLTGLFFGWPLMWPTISAEEAGDVYEATSRTFAYTFQAPIQYLFYVLVSIVIWVPAVMLVQNFTSLAEQVVFSGMDVAAEEGQLIQDYVTGQVSLDGRSRSFVAGAKVISGLHWFAHLMADAFCVGFFFSSFSGIYLLLRRFVDHTPLDEVFVIDDKTKYGLEDLIQQTAEQSAESTS